MSAPNPPLSLLTADDIPEVMRLERLPGYEAFIGRFTEPEHAAEIASPDARYVGFRNSARLTGFVILQELRQPVVRLRRIAVEEVGRGAGTRLLRAAMDWVFESTPAAGVRLDVALANDRARHVYLREGFTDEGADQIHYNMSIPRERWAELRARR